jgi:hypothetical protein
MLEVGGGRWEVGFRSWELRQVNYSVKMIDLFRNGLRTILFGLAALNIIISGSF